MQEQSSERLRRLRKERRLSLRQLAALAGLSHGTIGKIEGKRSKAPSDDTLRKLERALGVAFGTLGTQTGDGSVPRMAHLGPEDIMIPATIRLLDALPPGLRVEVARYLPEVGQPVAARTWAETTTEYFPGPPTASPNAFILEVTGRCMEPRIRPGMRVLVDRGRTPVPGDVVLAVRENEATLKRLVGRDDGSFLLVPDNPLFAPIEMDRGDTRIVGVAIDVFTGKP